MKRTIFVFALLGFVPTSVFATVLSFDLVTGVIEATTDGSETNSCNSPDICAQALTFADIGGSGVSATVTSNSTADGTGTVLWDWYDRSPSLFGGMGAATQDEADSGGASFTNSADDAVNEFIIVTFSQVISLDAFWMNGGVPDGHGSSMGLADLYLAGLIAESVACIDSFCDNQNLTGTTFAFFGGDDVSYYLAGLDFSLIVATPEPGIVALFALGLIGIVFVRRRMR